MRTRNSAKGFSLVELMVGVAVALVALLVLTGLLMSFNNQKRTTVSSSDAQVAGGLAAFLIERDLRRAGYGFNSEPLLGCTLHLLDPTGGPSPLQLDPVRITPGAAGAADQVAISFSNSTHGWYFTTLSATANYPGDDTAMVLSNSYGFNVGDLIAVGMAGVDPDANGIEDCSLREVTAVNAQVLQHTGGTYNKPGGELIPYPGGARVYNIGTAARNDLPEFITYAINDKNELTMTSRQTQFQPVSIGEHIVMLRAWYCKDTANPTPSSINICDQVVPVNAAAWRQVIAVRFAVVARSPFRETEAVSSGSVQLWPEMVLPNGATLPEQTMPLDGEQQHYRYRVYGTLVPIRNLIWQVPNS